MGTIDFFVCSFGTIAGVGSKLISISVFVFFTTVTGRDSDFGVVVVVFVSAWDPFVSVDVFLIEERAFFSSRFWRTSDVVVVVGAAVAVTVGVSLREKLFEVFIRGLDGKRGTGETGGESKCWDFEKPPPRVDEFYWTKRKKMNLKILLFCFLL